MTTQPHHGTGHITSTQDPGWCLYCGLAVPEPPAWDWATARAEVIIRAAETARCQRETRRRLARTVAARRLLDTAIARATSTVTWSDIIRGITVA